MGSPVNFLSNVPSFVLETVSVRITRARSNREEDGRAFSRSSSLFLPFPLPISIPPLFRVFKSTLHQLACPVDVSCPPFSPLARSVCVGRASSSSIRVPGIRIPPGAKKGASCFHLKVPGHSPIFPLSFSRVFLCHHRHFRGHQDSFARRVRGNNFHLPFVFASRSRSRYPNSRSLSFSFFLV